jgi:hypothetical protein
VESNYTVSGGAQVGWFRASWPLAALTATPDKLVLDVFFLGRYELSPSDVTGLEVSRGLRIYHRRPDLPEKLLFWPMGRSQKVIQGIQRAGFKSGDLDEEPLPARGIPFRWAPLIAFVIIWNGLGLFGIWWRQSLEPSPFFLLPLGLLASALWILLRYPPSRGIILKPGRHFGEIEYQVRFAAVLSVVMFFIMGLVFMLSAFLGEPA